MDLEEMRGRLCSCLTKNPDITYHELGCNYRVSVMRDGMKSLMDGNRDAIKAACRKINEEMGLHISGPAEFVVTVKGTGEMDNERMMRELEGLAGIVRDNVADIDLILGRMVEPVGPVYVGKDFSVGDVRNLLKRIRFRMVGDLSLEELKAEIEEL